MLVVATTVALIPMFAPHFTAPKSFSHYFIFHIRERADVLVERKTEVQRTQHHVGRGSSS